MGSVCRGLAAGVMLPVWGSMLALLFVSANYGRAMGMMNPVVTLVVLGAPPLAGRIHDLTGGYSPGFGIFMGALLIPLALLPFIRLDGGLPPPAASSTAALFQSAGPRRGPLGFWSVIFFQFL